jgi:hypothetical protein
VTIGTTHVTLAAGSTETVRVSLNRTGRHLLAIRHQLKPRLTVSDIQADGQSTTVAGQTVTFTNHTHRR